jgi:hypothetical protein
MYTNLNLACREIRLLELLPGEPEQDLSCRLFTVSLDERPQYEVLIYNLPRPKQLHLLTPYLGTLVLLG